MPDLHIWFAFVLAAEALLILPGPTDMVVVSYALTQGKRSAWASVPGVTLGDATALILSLLGLGAILMASAELFNIVKIAGALYLVYLGIKTWRAPVPETLDDGAPLQHGPGASWRTRTWRPPSIPAGSCSTSRSSRSSCVRKAAAAAGGGIRCDLHGDGNVELDPLRHPRPAGAASGQKPSRPQEPQPHHRWNPDRHGGLVGLAKRAAYRR